MAAPATASKTVQIYQPSGKDGVPSHPSLSKAEFPIDAFQGKWFVIQSTLGIWKTRKDVTITYTPHTPPPNLAYNDHVQYRSTSSPSSKPLCSIVGISTLLPTAAQSSTDTQPHQEHGAHFKWRGSGWLRIASSKWQVLGYDLQEGWVVTFFEKTLFTPAGLDVYARQPGTLSSERLSEIVKATQSLGGEAGKLAEGFFEVTHGV
ncbi:hypothetical protein DACRYDRAFT_119442 [Dacryopinax primogenitus]|uniref:Lipocalin/cytosolic fatty-acid binding domain-containing protein n=1 Tax=Dacryopinax primogenitus (strain DJM 731) TaxID=1858805 RepID=M5FPU4_DACPD|nr:uncharacterized protein DACRYDRAFT_119442 [Dacryopinax primogenitus]EJT97318.1 hypothetical protein DACRYDRAFT_119442 [Dacryopinax primogenitus]